MLRGAGHKAKTETEKRLFPRRLEQIVYARHGRELAGCNAPARELKGIHDYECYQKNRPKARAPLRVGADANNRGFKPKPCGKRA